MQKEDALKDFRYIVSYYSLHFNVKFMPNKRDFCFKGTESKQRFTFCLTTRMGYRNYRLCGIFYCNQIRSSDHHLGDYPEDLLNTLHFMVTYA